MSTSALLLIALASVVLLLLLVIQSESHILCGAPDSFGTAGGNVRHPVADKNL